MPLAEFAVQCRLAAHEYRARARAEEMRRLVDMMKGILARVAKRLQRISARIAHA